MASASGAPPIRNLVPIPKVLTSKPLAKPGHPDTGERGVVVEHSFGISWRLLLPEEPVLQVLQGQVVPSQKFPVIRSEVVNSAKVTVGKGELMPSLGRVPRLKLDPNTPEPKPVKPTP